MVCLDCIVEFYRREVCVPELESIDKRGDIDNVKAIRTILFPCKSADSFKSISMRESKKKTRIKSYLKSQVSFNSSVNSLSSLTS